MGKCILWSDKWHIEDNVAWFIYGETNILFERNLMTGTVIAISKIPDAEGIRWNGDCIKYNNQIYCFPNRGTKLWIFSLETKEWEGIVIEKQVDKRMACQFVCVDDRSAWFVSRGGCKLYKLDLDNKTILDYSLVLELFKNKKVSMDGLSNGVVYGRIIYFAGLETNIILMFDMDSKQVSYKRLPIDDKFMRIQKVEDEFYIVGLKKAIYIWNLEKDMIKSIYDFPTEFGIYTLQKNGMHKKDYVSECNDSPLFCEPVAANENVWFVPWTGTEILYQNKETLELQIYEMEEENTECLEENAIALSCKYLLNYIRDNRYLGLYSVKNGCQLEIDMKTKQTTYLTMDLIVDKWNEQLPTKEFSNDNIEFFLKNILRGRKNDEANSNNVGKIIHLDVIMEKKL